MHLHCSTNQPSNHHAFDLTTALPHFHSLSSTCIILALLSNIRTGETYKKARQPPQSHQSSQGSYSSPDHKLILHTTQDQAFRIPLIPHKATLPTKNQTPFANQHTITTARDRTPTQRRWERCVRVKSPRPEVDTPAITTHTANIEKQTSQDFDPHSREVPFSTLVLPCKLIRPIHLLPIR